MSHDVDLVRTLHDIAQCVRHNARLDTRVLLHRLRLAAEELCLAADIKCDLIATASERKVELCLRLLAELLEGLLPRKREPDRERHGQPLGVDDLAYLIEDVKFLRNRMVERFPIDQCDELALRDAAHKAAKPVHPRVQPLTHGEEQHGLLLLRLPLHDLIIVVQLDVEERRTTLAEPLREIGELRLIRHVERKQRIHVRRRRHHPMTDAVGVPLMGEPVLPLGAPDRLKVELRPEIRDRRPLLGHLSAEGIPQLMIAPLKMSVPVHKQDGLRQGIDGVVHHIVDIADNAHTVALKPPLPVTTPFPCKCGKERPDEKRGSSDVGIIAERHERERKHDDQMDRKVDPRG